MAFLKINAFGDTNVGLVRKNNEDYLTYFEPGSPEVIKAFGRLYIVADGVGGAATGEVASKFSALKVLHTYYTQPDLKPWQRIKVGMKHANEALVSYIRQNAQARMATTMTAAAVNETEMIIVNVGDSRAYLLRGGVIKQLTQDHNLVNEMIRNGVLTEEQAKTARVKNQLTSSLGGHESFKADVFVETLQPGDRVLLCSDGFCRYAEDPEIVKKFMQTGTPQQIVNNCIQYARNSGGQDNISVLSLEVGELLDQIPELYDHGARPIPVNLREVVSNPLTLDARSPFQEARLIKEENGEEITQMISPYQPDPSIPAIPAREAYTVPGINMAADDSDLIDTGEIEPKKNSEDITTNLINEDTGAASVTSEQMRTVASQRIVPEMPQAPPESMVDKVSTRSYTILLIFSILIVIILAVMAVIFGARFLQQRRSATPSVNADAEATVEAVLAETDTALPEPTVEPTTEPTPAPSATLEPTLTPEPTQEPPQAAAAVDSTQSCLYQVKPNENLSSILVDGFGLEYDPNGDYYQRDCEGVLEDRVCQSPELIVDHSSITVSQFLVIPEMVDQTACEDSGGVWYLEEQ